MAKKQPLSTLTKSLQAGIVTGFVATTIGNFLGIITQSIAQTYYLETSIAAVTLASISMGIVGSLIFYFIRQQTRTHSHDIFSMIGLSVPTMITLFVLTNQYDAPFRVIAVSISYVVSLTTVILVPWLSEKYNVHEH